MIGLILVSPLYHCQKTLPFQIESSSLPIADEAPEEGYVGNQSSSKPDHLTDFFKWYESQISGSTTSLLTRVIPLVLFLTPHLSALESLIMVPPITSL